MSKDDTDDRIKLTAKQIADIDEISTDKVALKLTLKVALNYHSNRVNALARKERLWWNDMTEIYNLDRNKQYTIDSKGSFGEIVEMTKDQIRDAHEGIR